MTLLLNVDGVLANVWQHKFKFRIDVRVSDTPSFVITFPPSELSLISTYFIPVKLVSGRVQ